MDIDISGYDSGDFSDEAETYRKFGEDIHNNCLKDILIHIYDTIVYSHVISLAEERYDLLSLNCELKKPKNIYVHVKLYDNDIFTI
jgi:hypothetical protein